MWAKIEDLRARAGLVAGDTSKDAQLNGITAMIFAVAENYCDRKFVYQGDLEEFVHKDGHVASLHRYPIESIDNISGDKVSDTLKYHVEKQTGLIHFDQHVHEHLMKVAYKGGYKDGEWPADLLLAFWLMFVNIWNTMDPSGGGGGASVGGIESVTIQDVGTVRFATGASAAAVTSAADDPLTPAVINILSKYRRELC